MFVIISTRDRTFRLLTKSKPNRLHVCATIFESHFSFGSGGGVPAIGWGRGLVVVPVFVAFAFPFVAVVLLLLLFVVVVGLAAESTEKKLLN